MDYYELNLSTIIFEHIKKTPNIERGGLISESFSLWLKSPQKGAKNYPDHYPTKEKILRIVI